MYINTVYVPFFSQHTCSICVSLVASIHQKFPFQLQFYGEEKLGATDMVWVVSGKEKYANMAGDAKVDQVPATEDLSVIDPKVAASIIGNAQDLNKERFRANMSHFEAIAHRDSHIKDAKPNGGIFWNASARIVIVCGNLYHVKNLAAQLHANGMVKAEDDELQTVMRRLWAMVAIIHGCAPESCIWLSVMDSLLEDFAHLLIGHASARMHTAKMQRLESLRTAGYNPADASLVAGSLTSSETHWLNKCDRARQIFAELARFYRGAVILAYTSVSWGGQPH